MRPISLLPVLTFAGLGCLGSSALSAAEFKLDSHTFTLPAGFTLERIAGPGLTDRPVHADFDERGRLYVAESSGSNEPVKKQLEDKPHSILRLVDTNGDGVFDQRTVFADRMMFPEGVLWHDGSVYVTAPPEIWKLTDTNDDGVADRREVWFNPGTLTGCANDLHGPFLGRDGWIYWNKGAFAEQKLALADGGTLVTKAAHIFRRHPSGGGVEAVMTGGMDNPVEFVMTPAGDRFFTSTFMRHPGGGLRDGIGHASYGALFGKGHDVLDDHPRTSATLNDPIVHLGPAATSGLAYSESDAFGTDHRGNLYAALFNLQKITRHVLVPQGASFNTIDEDFLVSDQRDFHPTDVFEDADGSLIVINTGGWYKICCPTSQLYKPDVLGAIYRIRKQGMPAIADPRGLKLAWSEATATELAERLADARHYVRQRATKELAAKGSPAVPALKALLAGSNSTDARIAAVWTLTRITAVEARTVTREQIGDADKNVAQAALNAVALWRDRAALPDLIGIIGGGAPRLQLAAAEALGRMGDAAAVPALVTALKLADAPLAQGLTRALIDLGDEPAIRIASAAGTRPLGVIIALDQLGKAVPEDVLGLLSSENPEDRRTADWIVRRHADWGVPLREHFEQQLAKLSEPDDVLAAQMAQMAAAGPIQEWLGRQLGQSELNAPARVTLLRAMRQAAIKRLPAGWNSAIVQSLMSAVHPAVTLEALGLVASLPPEPRDEPTLQAAVLKVARDDARSVAVRLAALGALTKPFAADADGALFRLALRHAGTDQAVTVRQSAARAIGSQPLSPVQRRQLVTLLPTLGPMELNQVLGGLAEPADNATDAAVLAAIGNAKAFRAIPVDRLRTTFAKYPEPAGARVAELIAQLDEGFGEKQKRIDTLLADLKGGDVVRGQAIFNSPKAVCSSCHAIGYLGGDLGPDLTRIGQIRNERDLLEAIVYPSASFVRSYESVRVLTKDGEDHNGVVREDASDHLTLATGPGATVKVARSDIAETLPGAVSIMPAGLDEQLSKQELADLLAFLKATRW